jgi:tripartite-type tricarboxylate transporter receptor subunit TctC
MSKVSAALVVLATLATTMPTLAEDAYPTRPVKVIVCLPAGGGVDTVTRMVTNSMSIGQPIIVENKGGQGGNLGADAVYTSPPDGYTLLASQPAPITTNPLLYKSMTFDPKNFVSVAMMTAIPNVVLVRADFPAKTIEEFIAYVKANPGKVNYASQGNGTTSHLTAEMFAQAIGGKMNHIPYRGTAPAVNDLAGGHVDVMFNELATSLQLARAGKARILAVTTAKRVPQLPDVKTLQEAGLSGFVSDTWNAISAPPKTPAAIVAKINAAVNAALTTPELKSHFETMGLQPVGGTPANMAAIVKADTERWGQVIKTANVKLQ